MDKRTSPSPLGYVRATWSVSDRTARDVLKSTRAISSAPCGGFRFMSTQR